MKKKVLSMLVLGCAILSLTGCGEEEKVLTCTLEHGKDDTGALPTTTFEMKYDKDDKEKEATKTIIADFTNEDVDGKTLNNYEKGLKEMCGMYQNVSCETKQDGKKLYLIVKGSTTAFQISGIDEETLHYKEMKENLESQGYTCK